MNKEVSNKPIKEPLMLQKDDRFVFNLSDVDVFEENNSLWFKLSDIAKVLDVDKGTASKWKSWADDDEVKLRISQLGGHNIPYGKESLLYRILNKTNSPKARPFERWITKEVIPSIKKTDGSKLKLLEPIKEPLIIHENEIVENFSFTLSDVEILNENHIVWFRLSDIVKMLDITKSTASNWIYRDKWFDNDELKFTKSELGGHEKIYVSESALYRILNRSNSPKARPFERWITKEVIPSIRKNGKYDMNESVHKPYQPSEYEIEQLSIRKAEVNSERAKLLERLADKYNGKSDTFKIICYTEAANIASGKEIIELPASKEKLYSATEVAEKISLTTGNKISAQRIGSIAISHNLKDRNGVNGKWLMTKSKYSNKEVDNFFYNDKAIEKIVQFISE